MIIVTGAGKGIGKFLFESFEKTGPVIGTCYSTPPDAGDTRLAKVDVRNFEAVEAWKGSLDLASLKDMVLINCAGISYNAFAHKADVGAWRDVIETNLIGTFNVSRAFLPLMRERGFGRIINIGSVVAQRAVPGTSAYAASKAALWGLAKTLASENASKGITVNNINLGYSDIGMGQTQITAAQKVDLVAKIPTGRFAEPVEILSTIEFLIKNAYVNGTSIDLNGALA